MLTDDFIERLFDHLSQSNRVDSGLTEGELRAIQERDGFSFPPDLLHLLQRGVPAGEDFPDWRDHGASPFLRGLDFVTEGIQFDIEYNVFWYEGWGEKPPDLREAFEVARRAVAAAPKLVPIYAHRFLPAEPCANGNPVFSVYQTDIIVCGTDLRDYFEEEFLRSPLTPPRVYSDLVKEGEPGPRWIDFWSDLTRLNGAWSGDWRASRRP